MTPDQALDALKCVPMVEVLNSRGITKDFLARKLKAELNAKETKFIKLKKNQLLSDAVKEIKAEVRETLKTAKLNLKDARGAKVVYETTEEMIIAIDVKSLGIRQKAREDAQKLLELYPDPKLNVDFTGNLADMMRKHLAEQK